MADQWFYQLMGEDFGPVPLKTIADLNSSGMLDHSDLVREGEAGEWQPVRQIADRLATIPSADDAPDWQRTADDGIEFFSSLDELVLDDSPGIPPPEVGDAPASTATPAEPARQHPPADGWYCRRKGKVVGPFRLGQLKALVAKGRVVATDDVRHGEHGEWTSVAETAELPAAGTAPPRRKPAAAPAASSVSAAAAAAPPPQPAPAEPELPEDEQWFYWHMGQDHGPLSFAEIESTFEAGELTAEMQVKQSPAGEWQRLGSLPAFAPAEPPPTAAAEQKPATVNEPANAPEPFVPLKSKKKRSGPSFSLPRISLGLGGAGEFIQQNAKGLLLVPLLLAVVALMYVPWGDLFSNDRQNAEKFVAIARKVKAARKASATDISAIRAEAESELVPLIEELEKTAGARYPHRQQTLWATQYMDEMFATWGPEPSHGEEFFLQHVENARVQMNLDDPPLADPVPEPELNPEQMAQGN